MRFFWKIPARWRGSAADWTSLAYELLRHSAALTGELAWAVAGVAFGCRRLPRTRWERKVCRTGRRLGNSDGAAKRRRTATLGSCMERWRERWTSARWSKETGCGSCEKWRTRKTRLHHLTTSAPERCQSSWSCLVYRCKKKKKRERDENTCYTSTSGVQLSPDSTYLVVTLLVSHCERRR